MRVDVSFSSSKTVTEIIMNKDLSLHLTRERFKATVVLGVFLLQLLHATATFSQDAFNARPYAVEISAIVQGSPAKITLSWPLAADTTGSYYIYRKTKSATSWGPVVAVRAGTATNYETGLMVGNDYEYQIVKTVGSGAFRGYGYIYAGIQVPPVQNRGKIILIVDNTYAAELARELANLQQNLVGDGWTVIRHDVARAREPFHPFGDSGAANTIRNIIKTHWGVGRSDVRAVFLFGRIPVLRSGHYLPDGHANRFYRAYPADTFYGDMTGTWTDIADDPRQHPGLLPNPGDGIYDHAFIPSNVELIVGRVDFADLDDLADPAHTILAPMPPEINLLRQYVNKNHDFRHKQGVFVNIPRRGLIASAWGAEAGEAYAASGYRNFAPFFGASEIETTRADSQDPPMPPEDRWISKLQNNTYLWAYGSGAGDHDSVAELGLTGIPPRLYSSEVYSKDPRAVFTMLFGSWMFEWDFPDDYYEGNLLRAMVAAPSYVLTCSWSGRPHHFYHHMGLGETIGYGIRLSQNNFGQDNEVSGLYSNQVNYFTRGIHIGLMGDPTLRMHPVAPPSFAPELIVQPSADGVTLNWIASPDTAIQGYYLYKSSTPPGAFTPVPAPPANPLITGTTYTDTEAISGRPTYMLRAVKLEQSSSGTYTNLSQGVFLNGTWIASGNMCVGHSSHTATLLRDGMVLVAGGDPFSWPPVYTAELYDPNSGGWAPTTPLSSQRNYDKATRLQDGRVLVAGVCNLFGSVGPEAEIYDPVGGWTATNPMNEGRRDHTLTSLPNGKVLVAGGEAGGSPTSKRTAELYEPVTGLWTSTVQMSVPRSRHTATLLHNGKVLIAAGGDWKGDFHLATSELYDPGDPGDPDADPPIPPIPATWTPTTGSLATRRSDHTATLLPNGKVLVVGGVNSTSGSLATAELFDPSAGPNGSWTPAGSLKAARQRHTATLLPNGKVLVMGGVNSSGYLATAELYDPITGTWTITGSATTARDRHTATLLPNGRVLIAGGYNGSYLSSAELYDP